MFAAGASVIFHRDTSQGKGKLPSAFKCILESTYVHEPKPVLDRTGALPQNVQNSKNVILCTRKDTNLSLNQEGEGFPVSSSTAAPSYPLAFVFKGRVLMNTTLCMYMLEHLNTVPQSQQGALSGEKQLSLF